MTTRSLRNVTITEKISRDDEPLEGELQLLKKQIKFIESTHRITLFRGGIRSGKTVCGAFKSIFWAYNGEDVLVVGPTYQMVMDAPVATIEIVCGWLDIPCVINTSRKYIKIGKGKIFFRSAEKPDTIRGFAASHLWLDECDFMKDDAYKTAIGRLSQGKSPKIIMTSSPSGKTWVYRLTKSHPDALILTQSIYENFFLSQEFIDELALQYTEQFADQELRGKIVNFSGSVYPTDKLVTDDISIGSGFLFRSWDLGFGEKKTNDYSATALMEWDGDTLFIHDVKRFKFEAPALQEKMAEINSKDPLNIPTLIEANGPQVTIIQNMRAIVPDADWVKIIPKKGKNAKAIPVAALMNRGKLVCSEGEWNEMLKDEWDEFSMDDSHMNDDMVDCIAQGYEWVLTNFVGTNPTTSVEGFW